MLLTISSVIVQAAPWENSVLVAQLAACGSSMAPVDPCKDALYKSVYDECPVATRLDCVTGSCAGDVTCINKVGEEAVDPAIFVSPPPPPRDPPLTSAQIGDGVLACGTDTTCEVAVYQLAYDRCYGDASCVSTSCAANADCINAVADVSGDDTLRIRAPVMPRGSPPPPGSSTAPLPETEEQKRLKNMIATCVSGRMSDCLDASLRVCLPTDSPPCDQDILYRLCQANPYCAGPAGVAYLGPYTPLAVGGAPGTGGGAAGAPLGAPGGGPVLTVADLSSSDWPCSPTMEDTNCFTDAFVDFCEEKHAGCADALEAFGDIDDDQSGRELTSAEIYQLNNAFAAFAAACDPKSKNCDPRLKGTWYVDENSEGDLVLIPGCSDSWYVSCVTEKELAEDHIDLNYYLNYKKAMRQTLEIRGITHGIAALRGVQELMIHLSILEPDYTGIISEDLDAFFTSNSWGQVASGRWEESICMLPATDVASGSGIMMMPGGSAGAWIQGARTTTNVVENFDDPVRSLQELDVYLITASLTPSGFTKSSKYYTNNPEECPDKIKFRVYLYREGTDSVVSDLIFPPSGEEPITLYCNNATWSMAGTSSYLIQEVSQPEKLTKACIKFMETDDLDYQVAAALDGDNQICSTIIPYGTLPDIGCEVSDNGFVEGIGELISFSTISGLGCPAYDDDDDDSDDGADGSDAGGGAGSTDSRGGENRPLPSDQPFGLTRPPEEPEESESAPTSPAEPDDSDDSSEPAPSPPPTPGESD